MQTWTCHLCKEQWHAEYAWLYLLIKCVSFFVHSWFWRLQSIWFPGVPPEICAVPYCECIIFYGLHVKWKMLQLPCADLCLTPAWYQSCVCLFRTGSRMNECWKRPLRRWLFCISPSGEQLFTASVSLLCVFVAWNQTLFTHSFLKIHSKDSCVSSSICQIFLNYLLYYR